MFAFICLVLAFFCFVLGAFNVPVRINFTNLGLAFLTLSFIVAAHVLHT